MTRELGHSGSAAVGVTRCVFADRGRLTTRPQLAGIRTGRAPVPPNSLVSNQEIQTLLWRLFPHNTEMLLNDNSPRPAAGFGFGRRVRWENSLRLKEVHPTRTWNGAGKALSELARTFPLIETSSPPCSLRSGVNAVSIFSRIGGDKLQNVE